MNILHTSDWHLGQNFRDKDRQSEHRQFFQWLIECITEQEIDVLIVAGDIYDTVAPPNYARELLFSFLKEVLKTNCRYVIIVGGNHDSVTNLNAPREILELLNVYVIGGMCENIDDEVILIENREGKVEGIVCAVPYLRDRDIRKSLPGESYDEKRKAVLDGVKKHYQDVIEVAIKKKNDIEKSDIPIIATGHLFAAGGQHSDGEREIYIGGEGNIDVASFPKEFDYVALGHLHKPQIVGKCEHIRYSGSPIPLSFSEAQSTKQVVKVAFNDCKPGIQAIDIPEFQKLRVFKGNLEKVKSQVADCGLGEFMEDVWAEFHIETDEYIPDLEGQVNELTEGTKIETFAVKDLRNSPIMNMVQTEQLEDLEDLTPQDVFMKRLEADPKEFADEDMAELTSAFQEILNSIHEKEEKVKN